MGIFEKIKNKFNKKEEQLTNEDKNIAVYDKGLTKSRTTFTSKLLDLTKRYTSINDSYFEELEEILIMADLGINTVMNFIDKLKKRVKEEKITDPTLLKEIIVDELFIIYVKGEVISTNLKRNENGPTVYLFVGVNGVGKTTSIAKLALKEKEQNKKVLLIAGDTFRAGATSQLKEWANKIEVAFYGKQEGIDPASVIYEGLEYALNNDIDTVFIDTAGRLQNKSNLMKELEKVNRVIAKIVPNTPTETLLVIDATTGQNGISQAKSFKEIANITGIILTKLDGTAKGGIVLAIKEEVNIPVKYIGLGEKATDLQEFDIEKYIYSLFKDFMED